MTKPDTSFACVDRPKQLATPMGAGNAAPGDRLGLHAASLAEAATAQP